MNKIKAAALAAAVSVLLSACEHSVPQEEDTDEIEPAPPFSALGEVKEGRKNVYVIIKNLESTYWQVVVDGAKDAAVDFDCNVYFSGSHSELDWESQARLVDEALAADADAVIFAPNDSVQLADKVEKVYDSDAKIVLVDTAANTDSYDVCYMTDNLMAGQKAAAEMLKQLRANGNGNDSSLKVGIQVGSIASQTINERLAGFLQHWVRYAPEGWEVISDIKSNDGDIEKGCGLTRDLMNDYPDLKGVFGCNNGSTVALAKVIMDEHRTDIALVGFDYSDEMEQLIKSDEYAASSLVQRQYYMSYTGIETALRLIDGENSDVKFVDTGIVVVNRDNLDYPEVKDILSHN